jgi:hypothetical protein
MEASYLGDYIIKISRRIKLVQGIAPARKRSVHLLRRYSLPGLFELKRTIKQGVLLDLSPNF